MKTHVALVLVLFLFFSLAGCQRTLGPLATVTGYVTESRGGPVLAEVKISGPGLTTHTDEEGYFELLIDAQKQIDLFVEKEGYAGGLIEGICLNQDETLELEIPLRKIFNPAWSAVPPRILVDGVEAGDTLTGKTNLKITIEGDNEACLFYVYFSGMQRGPAEFWDIDVGEGEGIIDTTLYPNGKGFIRILAYDFNDNLAMKVIPVLIENETVVEEVPADLEELTLFANTYSATAGYYSLGRKVLFDRLSIDDDPAIIELPGGRIIDLQTVPADTTLYILVGWEPVAGADGYNVYRSFDGEDYQLLGSVTDTHLDDWGREFWQYDDFSPLLTPGAETFYKVVPYNSKGEGEGLAYPIVPIVPFNVNLLEPADGATDVPLQPTFKWETTFPAGPLSEGTNIYYGNWIFEATAGDILVDVTENAEEFTLTTPLKPAVVYSWDIASAWAWSYVDFEAGNAYAMGYAGTDTGSLNGEFIFTTGLGLE